MGFALGLIILLIKKNIKKMIFSPSVAISSFFFSFSNAVYLICVSKYKSNIIAKLWNICVAVFFFVEDYIM